VQTLQHTERYFKKFLNSCKGLKHHTLKKERDAGKSGRGQLLFAMISYHSDNSFIIF